jgi:tetratricopeptide (TPR) repeat protein/energy-coupling factor transporter ATP-binding protein EcfA2
VTETGLPFNPFPGLRPFEPDEDFLFFGREEEVDELLRRLRSNRLLAIVGTSGCGKSSLVRSGLIPALHSGFMAQAGSSWRVAILRPGEDPIGRLAAALDAPDIVTTPFEELASTNRVLLDVGLRRGTRGLVEVVRQASLPPETNLLVVVDQFEELFRFERSRAVEHSGDEAAAFVKLLLQAASQEEVPIYVVLTMRADFIGDCIQHQGLPEALNASQYLVPRLTRDELRSAITGPVAVAGGEVAPRLVLRLLNDLGNDHDRLPVLQHALMRTWDYWSRNRTPGEPMDVKHYEAVGTMLDALSRHTEEAYNEVGSEQLQRVTEGVFKALTDTVADPRGTRRPCSVSALSAITGASEADVIASIEPFRRQGRSFLMPPGNIPLASSSIVDLSHESLMRCWTRLISWAESERASAEVYLRLTRATVWFEEGSAGLWRDPELELGLRWKRDNRPSAAWAHRYGDSFERVMTFLARSEQERNREQAERIAARRRRWRQLQWTALLLAALLVYAVWNGIMARRANALAEANLRDAVRAVDQSLAMVDREPELLGSAHPDIIVFRRDLAERARDFLAEFVKRDFGGEQLRQSIALAHFTLGHANRVLGSRVEAEREYVHAIEQFSGLKEDYPAKPEYRQALANSYTFLGESLRPSADRFDEAKNAYDSAIGILQELRESYPERDEYQQDLARGHYNRGILLSTGSDDGMLTLAESDFREAVGLLEPLVRKKSGPSAAQELSRTFNNLASLLAGRDHPLTEVERLYTLAVQTHEELVGSERANREYRFELSKFYNNLSYVQREQGLTDRARESNDRARELLEELAKPAPSLGIEQADAVNLRARILESRGWREALPEYERSLGMFERLERDPEAHAQPEFHLRFGDLLGNLVELAQRNQGVAEARQLLTRAVMPYLTTAGRIAQSGAPDEAQSVVNTMERLLPLLSDRDRSDVNRLYRTLEPGLRARAALKDKN